MSELKKLIINGQEYTITDGGAVAFDEPQTLTDEQKTQARKNIGAAPMIVTITNDVASHTSAEIYAHVQAGGTALLIDGEYIYALVGCTEGYASFDHSYDDGLLDNILIYGDGSVERREYAKLGSGTLSNYIPRPFTAEVGQTIVVKSVDANGKPAAWECADLPTPKDGEDGVSVTHAWDGTVLTITSASGTSSADLKGEKGETGPAYTLTDTDKATIASAVKASLTTESWTFTLEDDSTVTKAVYVG